MSIADDRIRHERAMERGRECRRNNGKREQNPYRLGSSTSERDSWLRGFEQEDDRRKVRK